MERDLQLELFDRYINGEMSDNEANAFREKLKADTTLKKDFDFHVSVVNGIRESRKLEMKKYMSENAKKRVTIPLYRNLSIAVAALLVILFSIYLVIDRPQDPIANNGDPKTKNPDGVTIETGPGQNMPAGPQISRKMDSRYGEKHYTYDGKNIVLYNINDNTHASFIKEKNLLIVDSDTFSIEITAKITKLVPAKK